MIVGIKNTNDFEVSHRNISREGDSYVETTDKTLVGKCFALLVTAFCYKKQLELGFPIEYSVLKSNKNSVRIMEFFLTQNDLLRFDLNIKAVQEYLQTLPTQSISMQKDPIELKESKETFHVV